MDNSAKKIGAVLVVGGGVGGMQAALDLAESGIKVYLVEKQPAIGGTMAQLDKTFPTNDCAMCTISPRLVGIGRHLNIEVLPQAEVVRLEGEAGHFSATLKRRSRYIDPEKCTGCGRCAEKCPVEVPDRFNVGTSRRKAVYKLYPQAVPGTYTIDKQGRSPCKSACPAGVSAHAYVKLIAQGKFAEALAVEKRFNPFPGICGRVCTHPCEAQCNRLQIDEAVSVRSLKRFLADWEVKAAREGKLPPVAPIPVSRPERIAIVGSGPAGMTLASDLARAGYRSTVFEALAEPGGMLTSGIPAYRLPDEVIATEIKAVCDLGVELRTGSPVGRERTLASLQEEGYAAIFLAVGAHRGMKLKIPGEDEFAGVEDCIRFLHRVNRDDDFRCGKRVVVVGGGNSAIDAARTALRLGADEVTLLYRRTRQEMPADPAEIEEAFHEGVKPAYLASPVAVLGREGKVTGLRCVKMELGAPDASGRRRPVPVPGSEFTLDCDEIISAIGQEPDLSLWGENHGLPLTRGNLLAIHPVTGATGLPGVFAGGDAVTGPDTAIGAIGAAHRYAAWIRKYLEEKIPWPELTRADRKEEKSPLPVAPLPATPGKEMPRQARVRIRSLSLEERKLNFREVELGMTEEEAVTEAKRCLGCGICCECNECVKACEANAILHEDLPERESRVEVGAVILAPGFDLFRSGEKKEYGAERYPNVLSALEFERQLSASGPTLGQVIRPSDGRHPQRLAFIQCVGSREQEHDYCSSVCCMYAIKQAILAKEHDPGLECVIYFIDLRAFGKGFDAYYQRAVELGIRFERTRPSAIRQREPDRSLLLKVRSPGGEIREEVFDLVVLSCGLRPPEEVQRFREVFGLELSALGFAATDRWTPQQTTRAGIFVCGPFVEPQDIPETVTQASAAAAAAMADLAAARGTLIRVKEYPVARDVAGEAPRLGVFVCHCGKNIGGVVDVPSLVAAARKMPGVVFAEENLYTCSQDTQEKMRKLMQEYRLNRVVVASCTPRTHEPLFQETLREGGLNPYLFEMANIRDQCTWVHRDQPQAATRKALDLLRMAVARAREGEPLLTESFRVEKEVLVVGGGLAGMTAALSLARQGFPVHLVEQDRRLGGMLWRIHETLEGKLLAGPRDELIAAVTRHPGITVHLQSRLRKGAGFRGHFTVDLATPPGVVTRTVGAILVATGGAEYRGPEYGYGTDPRVISQLELEERLAAGTLEPPRHVVMIQCVGSRNREHPYCSRLCCAEAVKNALRLKQRFPGARVTVLYRDLRTYGLREGYYTRARRQGVIFLRYHEDRPPEKRGGPGEPIRVRLPDESRGQGTARPQELPADLLVLSLGVRPHPEGGELSGIMKIPQTADGFFLEAHMKLRPVEFASEGIYLAGLAHYPKFLDETMAQASAAAARIATLISHDTLEVGGPIARVDPRLCATCLTCLRVCPYQVPRVKDGVAVIEVATCHGCGTCAGACPAQAIQLLHTKDSQVLAKINALFGLSPVPGVGK